MNTYRIAWIIHRMLLSRRENQKAYAILSANMNLNLYHCKTFAFCLRCKDLRYWYISSSEETALHLKEQNKLNFVVSKGKRPYSTMLQVWKKDISARMLLLIHIQEFPLQRQYFSLKKCHNCVSCLFCSKNVKI